MSRKDPDEDVAVCFSQEEWKLLHEWQKELYKNVMKEIRQALISLGPLIVTMVCSLKSKEKEALYPVDNECSEGRRTIHHSSGDVMTGSDRPLQRDPNSPQDSHTQEGSRCPSRGYTFLNSDIPVRKGDEPISIFIDHLGAEIGDGSTDPNSGFLNAGYHSRKDEGANAILIGQLGLDGGASSAGHGSVASFHIKEEEGPYSMDRLNSERAESITSPTGDIVPNLDVELEINKDPLELKNRQELERREAKDYPSAEYEVVSFRIKDEEGTHCMDVQDNRRGHHLSRPRAGEEIMKKRPKGRYSVNHSGKATPCEPLLQNAKVKMVQSYEEGTHARGLLWSNLLQEQGAEENTPCESGLSDPENPRFQQGPVNVQTSETYSDSNNPCLANLFTGQPGLQEPVTLYSCTECEKSFSRKEYLLRHKRTHVGVRPHQCTECEKSFRRTDSLSVHKRTHTGERPYHCTICDKTFNQVGAYNRHQRIHLGERPYQCNHCERRFTQNGTLLAHLKTHNPRNGPSSQL